MHTQTIGEGILSLAVRKQAPALRERLGDLPKGSPSAEFLLELRGLPEYTLAKVTGARRHDDSIRVHIHALNGVPVECDEPLLIDLPAAPELEVEDDSITGKNGTRWYPAPGGMQREVIDIDDAGEPVSRNTNTDKYNYQMVCACGNVRYAKRNSVHQVDKCRKCSKEHRHAYQVSWQREHRKAAKQDAE